jgi:hypothetical protein
VADGGCWWLKVGDGGADVGRWSRFMSDDGGCWLMLGHVSR